MRTALVPETYKTQRIKSLTNAPVAVAKCLAHQTAEQEVGSSNPDIPSLLKHACGEGDWLLCWHYIPAKVSHQEVNLSEHVIHMPPPSANKAEHRGDVTRSPKQGYQ